MIEKRYQHWTKNGLEWTRWFPFDTKGDGAVEAKRLNKEMHWQYKNKALNQFRYVCNN